MAPRRPSRPSHRGTGTYLSISPVPVFADSPGRVGLVTGSASYGVTPAQSASGPVRPLKTRERTSPLPSGQPSTLALSYGSGPGLSQLTRARALPSGPHARGRTAVYPYLRVGRIHHYRPPPTCRRGGCPVGRQRRLGSRPFQLIPEVWRYLSSRLNS